jgi:hypothetical protein
VRRTVVLALTLVLAGCGEAAIERPRPEARAAGPQRAELGWRETYPARSRERIVFAVDSLEVTPSGWTASIALANETSVPFETLPEEAERRYGLMLFATGDLAELEEANRAGELPPPRQPETIEPLPPRVLRPGATWRGRLTGSGSLPAGSYVRVAFGPLVARGDPPEDMESVVRWITDRSHRLRP